MKTYLPALLAAAALVACGSGDSTSRNGSGVATGTGGVISGTCQPGNTFPCVCPDQRPSQAICQPDGMSAVCVCSSVPNGGGGVSSVGGTPNAGGVAGSAGFGGFVGGSAGIPGTGGTIPGTGGAAPNTGGAAGGSPGTGCLTPGSGDYAKAGPYKIAPVKTVDLGTFATLPSTPTTYSIFYPENLNDSCPHPVVAWGNGTTVTGPNVYSFFHNNLASWGIVVIASDNPNSAGGFQSGISQDVFLKPAMDYMIAQNADSTSQFFGKLSADYGTAGHSQGAIAATASSKHPNVRAEAQVEGGGTPKPGIAFLALSGTADTLVGTQAPTSSYNAATGPSMLAIYTGADHTGTPTALGWAQQSPGTIAFLRLYTAWFRCYLGGDGAACAVFRGQGCGICSDTNWATLDSKNL